MKLFRNNTPLVLGIIALYILIPLCALAQENNQATAQNKSNGTINLISCQILDSIVFKLEKGKEATTINVYLVSENSSYLGNTVFTGTATIRGRNLVYGDEGEFLTGKFNVPADFIPEKIKFVVDGKDMYYDIAQSEWDSKQAERSGTPTATATAMPSAQPIATGDTPYAYCYGENRKCTGAGCSQIKVITPSNSDVLVTLKQNEQVVAHAYIRAGSSYTFQIPNGTYQPFFYYGSSWDSEKIMKQTNCGTLRGGFSQNEHFGKDTPERLNNNVLTYELILQQNGNFSTIPSNRNEAF